jgi:hypothetical protein
VELSEVRPRDQSGGTRKISRIIMLAYNLQVQLIFTSYIIYQILGYITFPTNQVYFMIISIFQISKYFSQNILRD